MKRAILILVGIMLILTFIGCQVVENKNTSELVTKTEPTTVPKEKIDNNKEFDMNKIEIDDFNIIYKGVLINDIVPFEEIAKGLGFQIGNSEGDSEIKAATTVGNKSYSWIIVHYPNKKNEELGIEYLMDDKLKIAYLVTADLYKAETYRGIRVGDSAEKLINAYGNYVKPEYNNETTDYYEFCLYKETDSKLDKSLLFVVDKKTKVINEIWINYNHDKAMIEADIDSFAD